jgi:rare lipoprotein A (peptidoglycan hydrolase)
VVTLASLSIAAVSTARPPSSTTISLDPEDLQPLALKQEAAAAGTPWPSFELPAAPEPVPIGDFQEPDREFGRRVTPNQPERASSILKPPPKPKHSRRGTASWYCKSGVSECHYQYSGGMYAAAGPALRVGDWRGRTVLACASGRCVYVRLVDWCECPSGNRVIDLYSDAYRRLAPLSSGTVGVTVYW